jgi:hypothetical protein
MLSPVELLLKRDVRGLAVSQRWPSVLIPRVDSFCDSRLDTVRECTSRSLPLGRLLIPDDYTWGVGYDTATEK